MSESSLAKWLRWLIWYGAALVPLVIFGQFMSPFHFGKVVILRSIVEVMLLLYVLLVMRDRSYLPKSHPITWAFVAFTAAFTLTTITSIAPTQSFWGTLERMGGLWSFWHYLIFYVITVSVLRTKQDWQTLIDIIVAVGLVSALYGFLQKTSLTFILGSGGRQRIFGSIGNPALFAGYQILVAYLAATLSLTKKIGPAAGVPRGSDGRGWVLVGAGCIGALILGGLSSSIDWLNAIWLVPLGVASYGVYLVVAGVFGKGRWFYMAVAGITAFAAASTAVRGSLLAMVVATLVFILLYSTVYRSRFAKNALLMGVGVVAVFVFLGILLRQTPLVQGSPYLRRVTDFSGSTFTVQTRFWAWSAGFKGWKEGPKTVLVGWGPENFNVPFSHYFNPKFFTGPGSETFFDRAHNMFIEILVTMGLAGELTYLAMFGILFWALWRLTRFDDDRRIIGVGMISLIIAYIIHNAFIFDTSANLITFFMIMGFITHVVTVGIEQPAPVTNEKRLMRPGPWTGMQVATASVLSVVTLILVYKTDIKPAMANHMTTNAIVAGWQGDFVTAVNDYRTAIDYNTAGRYEFRHRFAQYLLELTGSADVSKVPNFDQVLMQAIDDVKDNVKENPSDYLPLLYLSRLYITLGKNSATSPYNTTALEYSMKALDISPTFVRTYYEIAQVYLNTKQFAKAYEYFDKARQLNPDVGITYWYLGVVRYQLSAQTNDTKGIQQALVLINEALTRGYTLTEQDAQKLISIYVALGDINSVIGVYESLLKQMPNNPQYWAALAAAYQKVGRIQDAITAVRKALALAPNDADLQAEGKAFLKTLGATP